MPFAIEELLLAADFLQVTLGELLGKTILSEKGPRPAVRDKGQKECSPPDSNQQPTDYLLADRWVAAKSKLLL